MQPLSLLLLLLLSSVELLSVMSSSLLPYRQLFPFGSWRGADGRFELDCNNNGCAWTETQKDRPLTRQVRLQQVVGQEGKQWRIERPNNDAELLAFLGAADPVAIISRGPALSFMILTFSEERGGMTVEWNGLSWTLHAVTKKLDKLIQPASDPSKTKQFVFQRALEKEEEKLYYHVEEGQLTFDAEGQEGTVYHSRHLHHPSSSSGVTVGRGFDLKKRDAAAVVAALVQAGVEDPTARVISQGAGKSGADADAFVSKYRTTAGNISPAQQKRLFQAEYAHQKENAKGVYERASADSEKAVAWNKLDAVVREVYVDIIYQGYPPEVKRIIQPIVEANDSNKLSSAITKHSKDWTSPPRWELRKRRLDGGKAKDEL